ncbi:MAG: hypothetical protein R3361_04595 [Aequorivita vladivostokensis]|nr:hypothetical protein [Aequorivita vladivostokensis]
MNEFKLLSELRKSSIGFWIAFLLSLAEAGYTYVIVHKMSALGEPYRTGQALFIAILLDMAVLYFTLFAPKEREHISKFFLGGMLVNIILAQLPWNDYIHYVSIFVIAIEVAFAIYFFSEMSLIQERAIKKRVSTPARVKPVTIPNNVRTSHSVSSNGQLESEIIKLYTSSDELSYREIARKLGTNHKKVSRTIQKVNGNLTQ